MNIPSQRWPTVRVQQDSSRLGREHGRLIGHANHQLVGHGSHHLLALGNAQDARGDPFTKGRHLGDVAEVRLDPCEFQRLGT